MKNPASKLSVFNQIVNEIHSEVVQKERAKMAVLLQIDRFIEKRQGNIRGIEGLGKMDVKEAEMKAQRTFEVAIGNIELANSNTEEYLRIVMQARKAITQVAETRKTMDDNIAKLAIEIKTLEEIKNIYE